MGNLNDSDEEEEEQERPGRPNFFSRRVSRNKWLAWKEEKDKRREPRQEMREEAALINRS